MNKCQEIGDWRNTTLNGRLLYPLLKSGGQILGAGENREWRYLKTGNSSGSALAWRKGEPQIKFYLS
jgi:hypothetical protein